MSLLRSTMPNSRWERLRFAYHQFPRFCQAWYSFYRHDCRLAGDPRAILAEDLRTKVHGSKAPLIQVQKRQRDLERPRDYRKLPSVTLLSTSRSIDTTYQILALFVLAMFQFERRVYNVQQRRLRMSHHVGQRTQSLNRSQCNISKYWLVSRM